MPKGENNRKLNTCDIDQIVRRYATPLPDGTWLGTTSLSREFGVRPATINRWLRLRGIPIRSAREAHAHGKRCKPITNLPRGTAPLCKCGCAERTRWSTRKDRWCAYIAGHYRGDAPYKHRDWLVKGYVTENKTVTQLAAECGVSGSTVARHMKRFGIPRRSQSEMMRGRRTGALNHAWKGGVADWPYSSDWKCIARAIRTRDAWTCQDCRQQRTRWGNGLHVHHINGDKLDNASPNLVSLCAACHRARHRAQPSV